MVAELLPKGFNKGAAVHSLMAAKPFEGSLPIFIGDDVTDEDGFAAAADLGGFGILVGPARETAAGYRLEGVQEVYAWLTR
jgi:trehalose 6-phosphate phosphatase